MIVIPGIDLESGRVVKRVRGVRGSGATDLGDPAPWAERWVRAGARALHLVDLDGAEGSASASARAARSLLGSVPIPITVGGGVRSVEGIEGWLSAGADRVLVATRFWSDPAWREEVVGRFGGRLTVCLDVERGRLRLEGWTRDGPTLEEALDELDGLGVRSVLYTEVASEGTGRGAPEAEVARLRRRYAGELRAAGGIGGRDDLRRLAAAGADAAVVGHALVAGALPESVLAEEFR